MNKTKIVCSIGPASCKIETLENMIDAGMNVARFNMSHGTHESHQKLIEAVKAARANKNAPVAVMIDTKGPEIRIKQFKNQTVHLKANATFTLTTQELLGDNKIVSVTYKNLPKIVKQGTKILLNDGNIELCVQNIHGSEIETLVVVGGELSNNKSINLPGLHTEMPYLSETDKADLYFAKQMEADYLAISFVNCAQDVLDVKKYLKEINFNAKLISKIESEEGVTNFASILRVSDGIMVARGDLGVEVDFEKIPILQKEFIKACNEEGKISITATQMLESMITSSRPTRAEISDVANAVFDGSTAIMLSGETASGAHPVQSVAAMKRIALQAEQYIKNNSNPIQTKNIGKSLGYAAFALSQTHGVDAIVVVTKSGTTAQNISRFRPDEAIIACTPDEKTYHKMSLFYGVMPILDNRYKTMEKINESAISAAIKTNLVSKGSQVVLVSGSKPGKSGNNMLMIKQI